MNKLAQVIRELTYSEMMEIAENLAEAIAEKHVWPTFGTREDFATLLDGWAQGQPERSASCSASWRVGRRAW